LLKIRSYSRLA